MARKRKQSAFEVLAELVALFPWWVGLILAAVSYFWLHNIAATPVAVSAQPGQMGVAMSQVFYHGLAIAGQYVVPMVCVIGAAMSAYGRWRRTQLHEHVGARPGTSALNEMSWQEFEMLVGESFRRKGYAATETGGGGADGGVDLVLRKDGEKYLVQCKQWKAYKVGVGVVRELYGVMAASGAAGGFVVTSGVFTQEAKDFASGCNIELVDGVSLKTMIDQARSPASGAAYKPAPQIQTAPVCPKCGNGMVKRAAKQGANAGKLFWGCANYPQCRGIVPID